MKSYAKISKYRLVLPGILAFQYPQKVIKHTIREWVWASGVKKIASGKIRADMWYAEDAMVYTAYYDSSYWTGINFKGFGKKPDAVEAHYT